MSAETGYGPAAKAGKRKGSPLRPFCTGAGDGNIRAIAAASRRSPACPRFRAAVRRGNRSISRSESRETKRKSPAPFCTGAGDGNIRAIAVASRRSPACPRFRAVVRRGNRSISRSESRETKRKSPAPSPYGRRGREYTGDSSWLRALPACYSGRTVNSSVPRTSVSSW